MGLSPDEVFDLKRSFKLGSQQVVTRVAFDPTVVPAPSAGNVADIVYNGLIYRSGQLIPDVLYQFSDFKFTDVATAWELKWSALCNRGGSFTPVMVVTPFLQKVGLATVAAYYGNVSGNQLIAAGGTITADRESGALGGNGIMFVNYDSGLSGTAPPGWTIWGHGETTYDILTTIDGQVLAVPGEHMTGFVEVETVTPLDLIFAVRLLVELVGVAGTKLITVLISKGGGRLATRTLLAGPTRELAASLFSDEVGTAGNTVKEIGLDAAMTARGLKFGGYEARIGIPRLHLQKMIEAARETNVVAVMRANKQVAIELIERGAVGKPKALSIPGFKSSPETGVLTATAPEQFEVARRNNYFLIEADGVARRSVLRGGTQVTEELKINNPYWKVEQGQVIDPSGNPIVGDYDGLGALPMESPGRNLAPVPDDPIKGDWLGPDYERFMNAVNPKLDKMRVLHGAQDQFPDIKYGGKYGGLTDDVAYAVFPDGRVIILNGMEEQKRFYEAFQRQTAIGSYNKPGIGVPSGTEDIGPGGRRR